ncbi:hypothetical protein WN51_00330 [Melipona quadrifasciata]|uniref:Uncharacterized protein n=1 Tax=Melipona quadrifasciata TaxID=166423 RepID=A0A0M9A0B3_9HYME|nr:hypothetical protein WN51_00330 [Melipona quadrifasciata]
MGGALALGIACRGCRAYKARGLIDATPMGYVFCNDSTNPRLRVSNTRLAQAASGCAPSVEVLPISDVAANKAECGNTAKMRAPTSLAGSYDTSVWAGQLLRDIITVYRLKVSKACLTEEECNTPRMKRHSGVISKLQRCEAFADCVAQTHKVESPSIMLHYARVQYEISKITWKMKLRMEKTFTRNTLTCSKYRTPDLTPTAKPIKEDGKRSFGDTVLQKISRSQLNVADDGKRFADYLKATQEIRSSLRDSCCETTEIHDGFWSTRESLSINEPTQTARGVTITLVAEQIAIKHKSIVKKLLINLSKLQELI